MVESVQDVLQRVGAGLAGGDVGEGAVLVLLAPAQRLLAVAHQVLHLRLLVHKFRASGGFASVAVPEMIMDMINDAKEIS